MESLFGNAVNLPQSCFPNSGGPRPAWQAPSSCWENIRVGHLFQRGWRKSLGCSCGDESDIGIDVTGTDEFHSEYPFPPVFHHRASPCLEVGGRRFGKCISPALVCQGEAVVKALGCAFHLVDLATNHCLSVGRGVAILTFRWGLSGRLWSFPLAARGPVGTFAPRRRCGFPSPLESRRQTHEKA